METTLLLHLMAWNDDTNLVSRGGLEGLNQQAPPHYQTVFIPIEKVINFRTTAERGNPEGRSILRAMYKPWYFKNNLEEVEAICQRIAIVAGSGVGKSVLLGMMARYTQADVIVVGLIGERGREVKEFIEDILGEDGLARSVVVAAPADAPPLTRMQGANYATAIAEHFRDQGLHVRSNEIPRASSASAAPSVWHW